MSTMKRFRPTRSFSTAIGGPGAARRETELIFGSGAGPRSQRALAAGPLAARGLASAGARVPVRIDLPGELTSPLVHAEGVRVERDDTVPVGMMRVTFVDGSSELVALSKR